MTDIKIEIQNGKAELYTPYNRNFVQSIKALGGARWDSNKRCWTVSEEMIPHARKIMMDVYGYTDEEKGETVTLKVTFSDRAYADKTSYVLFGKTLSRAYGRDSGAVPGEDVVYIEGKCQSGGSVKNWESVVKEGTWFYYIT